MATGGMAVYASEGNKRWFRCSRNLRRSYALEEVDGSQFAGEEWYDQRATFQVNREKAHTSFTSFQTVEDAKVRDKSNSPFYQLLSGQWKFEFAENPAGRNTEFYKNDYDVSNWDDITVPANLAERRI
ncbi:MAG: hypothetical protein ACLUGJ_01180 [Blautia wexlerae]